jgi:N-acetylglucosamine-6-phosphate deacetylase
VHLGLAAQPFHAHTKGAAIGAYCLAKRVITVKDGPKPERKDGAGAKADAYHTRMFQNGILFQFPTVGCAVELADYHGKLAAGIAQDWGSIHTLNSFEDERAPRAYSIV